MHCKPHPLRGYQTAALIVGLSEIVLLLCVLCVFLMPGTLGKHCMITTKLVAVSYHTVAMSVLVILQQALVGLYLWRCWVQWTADSLLTRVDAIVID